MTDDQPPFDDPSLKQAVRDLAGSHKASAQLREQVAKWMAAERVDEAPSNPLRINPAAPIRRILAMAATIIIGVGASLAAYEAYDAYSRSHRKPIAAPNLWASMAKRHDAGAKPLENEQPLAASLTTPAALAAEATAKLGWRVPPPNVADSGWTIDGASYVAFCGEQAVRIHLVGANRQVTVISLPAAAWGYLKETSYATSADGHQIAGYLKDGGMNCIVGDRHMPLADVQALVDHLRTQ